MTKRERLAEKIRLNNLKIKELENKNVLLQIETLKISDKYQKYSEKIEKIATRVNRKKVYEDVLIGKITWKEHFIDEDSGDVIEIERNQIVRRNDKWCF